MNSATLIIKGEMTTLNDYINAERNNRYAAAKIKKMETERVMYECISQKLPKFEGKVNASYCFYVNNNRTDEDNLLIYVKWINDGLVEAGIIKSDSRRNLHIQDIDFKDKGSETKTEVVLQGI